MGTVSTSFSAAAEDLGDWIAAQLGHPKQPTIAVSAADGAGDGDEAGITISPLALTQPEQIRKPTGIERCALAHFLIRFGADLPAAGAQAYDAVFFALIGAEGWDISTLPAPAAAATARPGLCLQVQRRIVKPVAGLIGRPVAEPLIFTVQDMPRPRSAERT